MSENRRAIGNTSGLKYQFRKNYGGTFRIGSDTLQCYTKKQLKNLHPAKDYEIVAEYAPKSNANQMGILEGDVQLPIFRYRSNNRFLYREKGYVALEDGEDRYVSLLQKVLPQRIAVIAVCLILAAGGTFMALNWINPVTLHDNTVPAAGASAPDLDTNAVDWQGAQVQNTGGVTPGIAIPGFKSITIDANTTKEKVNFSNPDGNPCYFEISLLLDDGTVLYQSKMIKPGQGIYNITLSKPLKAGTYDAVVKYDTYNLNGLAPMNGAVVKIQLIAQ